MDDWKKSNETLLLEKKISTVTYIWKILLMQTTRMKKKIVRF